MRDLTPLVGEYTAFRTARGFRPNPKIGRLLAQFTASLPEIRDDGLLFGVSDAVAWAHVPAGASDAWAASRLSTVRGFAVYLAGSGLPVQIPSGHQTPAARAHAVPYIYTPTDITALMEITGRLFTPLRAATMRTLVGLLAVTGMRIGETLQLDVGDVDLVQGVVTIRHAKGGRQRVVCLHESTCDAISGYLTSAPRHSLGAGPSSPLFVTRDGNPVTPMHAERAFRRMTRHADLAARPGARPRLHDLRHTAATRAMIDAYRSGTDPAATLAALAIWLGHSSPAHTYWYVHAVPELAAVAARLLEPVQEGGMR